MGAARNVSRKRISNCFTLLLVKEEAKVLAETGRNVDNNAGNEEDFKKSKRRNAIIKRTMLWLNDLKPT